MKFFAAIAALLVATVANAQSPAFTNCSTGTTVMTDTRLTLNPFPLCIGQQVCATITGTLSAPITSGGTFSLLGMYNNRRVYTEDLDLCTVLAASGDPCPLSTTTTALTACFSILTTLTWGIPFSWTILAINGDGSVLFQQCATSAASNCST